MKSATLALVVRIDNGTPSLVTAISDEREIALLETELGAGDPDPLEKVYAQRATQKKEEEEFGDYVEELLSQPFVRSEIREHGVQWLRSKVRIEEYQKSESEAAKVIADYAYKMFREDQARQDFYLAGPTNRVRVRILVLKESRAIQRAA